MIISFVRNEGAVFFAAVHLLTRFPLPRRIDYSPVRFNAAGRYYPLVGAIIGAIGALVYWVADLALDPIVAALLSTAATAFCTGAFHEDGLADTFDGIAGGHTRARALEIMKDSRIGSFGALALIIVVATKVVTLASLSGSMAVMAIVCGHIVSRTSSVITIATSRYAREDGTGSCAMTGISGISTVVATMTGAIALIALAVFESVPIAVGALLGAGLGHVGIRIFFQRRIGGYTGDCLGATQQITEVGIYIGIVVAATIT